MNPQKKLCKACADKLNIPIWIGALWYRDTSCDRCTNITFTTTVTPNTPTLEREEPNGDHNPE